MGMILNATTYRVFDKYSITRGRGNSRADGRGVDCIERGMRISLIRRNRILGGTTAKIHVVDVCISHDFLLKPPP